MHTKKDILFLENSVLEETENPRPSLFHRFPRKQIF